MINFETYGKQGKIKSFYRNVKERLSVGKHTKNLLRQRGVSTYTPKLNKARVGIASAFVGLCLVTPCTSWSIPFAVKWGLK